MVTNGMQHWLKINGRIQGQTNKIVPVIPALKKQVHEVESIRQQRKKGI